MQLGVKAADLKPSWHTAELLLVAQSRSCGPSSKCPLLVEADEGRALINFRGPLACVGAADEKKRSSGSRQRVNHSVLLQAAASNSNLRWLHVLDLNLPRRRLTGRIEADQAVALIKVGY
jgi:hypothetical protein